jgi:outer membrane protein assembly factor BamE (lipoprotein component of BamABCDE complex)
MKNLFFLLIAVFLFSCASPGVRYTYDEIKHYPPDIQERIARGEIALGMTKEQVRYAWGNPSSTRVLTPEKGKQREEWIYTSSLGLLKSRLIFIDGKLTYIISTEQRSIGEN